MTPTVDWWSLPKASPSLGNHQVHVWCAHLDRGKSSIETFWSTLSDDERTRAQRFHFERDRERYIVRRGLLRAILSRYLDSKPHQLRFRYGAHGKPVLAEGSAKDCIRFNLSHSNGCALLAMTRGRELGIDLERLRPGFANEEIAERFFSPAEVSVLRSLPEEDQEQGFFNCWTRKEAYIKAKGDGLSMPLDKFEVSLAPGDPVALLATRPNKKEASRWSLRELAPWPGYAAALCVQGHDWHLECWHLPGNGGPQDL